jgi:hypothetical protein
MPEVIQHFPVLPDPLQALLVQRRPDVAAEPREGVLDAEHAAHRQQLVGRRHRVAELPLVHGVEARPHARAVQHLRKSRRMIFLRFLAAAIRAPMTFFSFSAAASYDMVRPSPSVFAP